MCLNLMHAGILNVKMCQFSKGKHILIAARLLEGKSIFRTEIIKTLWM